MDDPHDRGVVDWVVAGGVYVLLATPLALLLSIVSNVLLTVAVDESAFDRSLTSGERVFYAVASSIPALLVGCFVGILLAQLGFQREFRCLGLGWALLLILLATFLDDSVAYSTPLEAAGMALEFMSSILALGLGLFLGMQWESRDRVPRNRTKASS